jgi:hypothetical protein
VNGNYRRLRDGSFAVSMIARRKRELAWALYCAEGYAANLRTLMSVNAFTMSRHDLRVIKGMLRDAEKHALGLRALITGEGEE